MENSSINRNPSDFITRVLKREKNKQRKVNTFFLQ